MAIRSFLDFGEREVLFDHDGSLRINAGLPSRSPRYPCHSVRTNNLSERDAQ